MFPLDTIWKESLLLTLLAVGSLCTASAFAENSLPHNGSKFVFRRENHHARFEGLVELSQSLYRNLQSTRKAGQRNLAKKSINVDYVERHNLTVILESVELYGGRDDGPWMYSKGERPFSFQNGSSASVHAFTTMGWNPGGKGNGTCVSGGSGRLSRGYLDSDSFYLELERPTNIFDIRADINNLRLVNFSHINTVDRSNPWNTTGQAGDWRLYVNGSFDLFYDDRMLLSVRSLKWLQNTSYPYPAGSSYLSTQFASAYFIGEIQQYISDDNWVLAIDPFDTGYVLGVVTAAAYNPDACFATASFWVTIRGFPDFAEGADQSVVVQNNTSNQGAKVGRYFGSSEAAVDRARTLGSLTANVTSSALSAVAVGTVATTAAAILFPTIGTSSIVMPGNGATRLIKNAAFVAKLREIRGFHTDSMQEYGENLRPFLAKFPFPSSSREAQGVIERWGIIRLLRRVWAQTSQENDDYLDDHGTVGLRQAEEGGDESEEASVSDDIFGGCSFYTSGIVFIFLGLHFIVWLFTRKRPLAQQVAPHAWMVYLLSVVMSYVYTASVLNSFQYLRSHVGKSSGKVGLMALAVIQLVFIDLAFLLFFVVVTLVAVRRLRLRNVTWIPRQLHHDPSVRRSLVVAGEYEAEDDNVFHGVFESYYSGLSGPRVWLAALEMVVTFLDAMFTAIIWNEVVCLTALAVLHSFLFALFVILGPFVDRIEGRLVLSVGFIDLVLLFLEFATALGSYETAEIMENIAITLGAISVAIAAAITVYCDLIPISLTVWQWLRDRVWDFFRRAHLVEDIDEDDWSQWSALSKDEAARRRRNGSGHVVEDGQREEGRKVEERLRIMGLRRAERGVIRDARRRRRRRAPQRAERWVRPKREEVGDADGDGMEMMQASAHDFGIVHRAHAGERRLSSHSESYSGSGSGSGNGSDYGDGDELAESDCGEEENANSGPMYVAGGHLRDEGALAERPQWARADRVIENVWDMGVFRRD